MAGFIGNFNFIHGKLSRSDRSVVLPDGTAIRGVVLDKVGLGQEDVSVMIRPDHFRLHNGEAAPRLHGTVTDTTYLGGYTQLSVLTPMGRAAVGPASAR